MKKQCLNKKSLLSLLVMLALLAAMALTFTACVEDLFPSEETTGATEETSGSNENSEHKSEDKSEEKESPKEEPEDDKVEFTLEVIKEDGTTKSFTIKSDKDNLGDALIAEGLIEGEEGQFGWYITTVDGEYHKYEEDGKYWAFYIDGEYAMTGVSGTPITEGATYTLKAE